MMILREDIQNFTNALVERYAPEKVILFGSHAAGTATQDSDVDLLVIMQYQGKASAQALDIRRTLKRSFPLDLIVQAPEETEWREKSGDPLIQQALRQGKMLYERRAS